MNFPEVVKETRKIILTNIKENVILNCVRCVKFVSKLIYTGQIFKSC
jgi:hypothetical protein